MQPSFDNVLVDVLVGDPNAHIGLQASRNSLQTEVLQRRMQNALKERLCGHRMEVDCPTMTNAYSRIHFLPRVKSDEVLLLIKKSTVVLHPFPVSK